MFAVTSTVEYKVFEPIQFVYFCNSNSLIVCALSGDLLTVMYNDKLIAFFQDL